jgi:hypothetical protein
LRQEEDSQSVRLGFRYALAPHSDVIASLIYRQADLDTEFTPENRLTRKDEGYIGEVQQLFRSVYVHLIGGLGHFNADRTTEVTSLAGEIRHTNVYGYSHINAPKDVTWTIGASIDFLEGALVDRRQLESISEDYIAPGGFSDPGENADLRPDNRAHAGSRVQSVLL